MSHYREEEADRAASSLKLHHHIYMLLICSRVFHPLSVCVCVVLMMLSNRLRCVCVRGSGLSLSLSVSSVIVSSDVFCVAALLVYPTVCFYVCVFMCVFLCVCVLLSCACFLPADGRRVCRFFPPVSLRSLTATTTVSSPLNLGMFLSPRPRSASFSGLKRHITFTPHSAASPITAPARKHGDDAPTNGGWYKERKTSWWREKEREPAGCCSEMRMQRLNTPTSQVHPGPACCRASWEMEPHIYVYLLIYSRLKFKSKSFGFIFYYYHYYCGAQLMKFRNCFSQCNWNTLHLSIHHKNSDPIHHFSTFVMLQPTATTNLIFFSPT